MKLENFSPTFRNVLLQEIEITKKGSIYVPSRMPLDDREYVVTKLGKDCTTVQIGDTVKLMQGMAPQTFKIGGETYGMVMEQQIVGYERNDSIRDAHLLESEDTGDSQLQTR